MFLQCICSCPTAYANGPSMAPTIAPAAAPAAEAGPGDMSDDDDDDSSSASSLATATVTTTTVTDSCDKPVPTQYEAFVDVSAKTCSQRVTNNVVGWLGAVQCVCMSQACWSTFDCVCSAQPKHTLHGTTYKASLACSWLSGCLACCHAHPYLARSYHWYSIHW